jgi:hypothetical protein
MAKNSFKKIQELLPEMNKKISVIQRRNVLNNEGEECNIGRFKREKFVMCKCRNHICRVCYEQVKKCPYCRGELDLVKLFDYKLNK